MNAKRAPRIGVIGNAALDDSGALCDAARLALLIQQAGAQTAFAGLVDDGIAGSSIRGQLADAGVDVSRIAVSTKPEISLGDSIDVAGLFEMDAVVIEVSDIRLHRFLVDLPVHTAPNARLIGLLSHLADHPNRDALTIALLHDFIIATSDELKSLTTMTSSEDALAEFQRRMTGSNLRTVAIFRSPLDVEIMTKTERISGHTASFEAFVASAVVLFAQRGPWVELLDKSTA